MNTLNHTLADTLYENLKFSAHQRAIGRVPCECYIAERIFNKNGKVTHKFSKKQGFRIASHCRWWFIRHDDKDNDKYNLKNDQLWSCVEPITGRLVYVNHFPITLITFIEEVDKKLAVPGTLEKIDALKAKILQQKLPQSPDSELIWKSYMPTKKK